MPKNTYAVCCSPSDSTDFSLLDIEFLDMAFRTRKFGDIGSAAARNFLLCFDDRQTGFASGLLATQKIRLGAINRRTDRRGRRKLFGSCQFIKSRLILIIK